VAGYYGDLNSRGGVEVCNQSTVFIPMPISIAFRSQGRPLLGADHGDKTVILAGTTKTVHYRFLPVTK
jgi:hypothetical protein